MWYHVTNGAGINQGSITGQSKKTLSQAKFIAIYLNNAECITVPAINFDYLKTDNFYFVINRQQIIAIQIMLSVDINNNKISIKNHTCAYFDSFSTDAQNPTSVRGYITASDGMSGYLSIYKVCIL